MSLGFPRQLFMDMYLSGWTDITEWVRMAEPVTAKQGQADEQNEPASYLTATLDNSDGRWVFNNPMGAYYGKLRASIGVRWGWWLAQDTCARIVSNGWGTMDSLDVWTNQGTASNFAVAGGLATHSVPTAGTFLSSRSGAPVRNVYVKVDYTPGFTNVTGGPIEPANIMLRWVDASNWYLVRLTVETDETYAIDVIRSNAGLEVPINPVSGFASVAGLTHTSGQKVSIAAAIEERCILVKVWLASDPEPDTWNLVTHDVDHENVITSPGQWGIRSGIDSANTNALPMTFSYSGLVVKNIRASGELTELIPNWDETHQNKTVRLRADGVLRRLRQGNTPVKSTLRRGIDTSTGVVAYWSGEDEEQGATSISSNKEGVGPLTYAGEGPLFASNDDFACSKPLPVLRGHMWFGDIPTNAASGFISFQFLASVPDAGSDDAKVLGAIFTTGTVRYWDVLYHTISGGSIAVRGYNNAGTLVADSGIVVFVVNGKPCRIELALTQSGANISCRIAVYKPMEVDAWAYYDFSSATQTLGAPVHVNMNSNSGHTNVALGHIVVYNIHVDLFQLADETKAYLNELIARRWRRLGDENNIVTLVTTSEWASYLEGARIGPQRPNTLRALFLQCAATAQAFIFEAKSTVALGLRSLETMWTQTPLVELDYEDDQIAAPLTPAPDDQGRRNDIVAKRSEGGEFRSTQTAGPNNVNPPSEDPEGVGLYEAELDPAPNVMTPDMLRDVADFALVVGTNPEARYSQITLQLSSEGFTEALTLSALDVGPGDRITVSNLTDADIYAPIDQLVLGIEEVWLEDTVHTVTYNTTPAGPYNVLTLDTDDCRTDGDVTLAENLDTTETGVDVSTVDAELTTDAGDHPYRCTINGEEIIVTACSGSGTSFTLTVIRSVNEAVCEHTTGDAVLLSPPVYLGRRGN